MPHGGINHAQYVNVWSLMKTTRSNECFGQIGMLDDLLDLESVLQLPPLEFCIEDLLPRGGLIVLGGDPKWGKSVILLDLVLRGVQARSAFGRYQQRYQKVLLVNIEGRHQGIRMRDMMLNSVDKVTREKILVSGKPFRFTLPTGAPNPQIFNRLREVIVANKIELAVLDPLISFHSGDENNSQHMVAILDDLRSVGEATGCAFMIIHHTRKMGSQQTMEDAIDQGGNMLRGASGIFGAVDSLVLLWRIDDGRRRLLTFSCRYARGDTSAIEMQMDQQTWRMFPMRGGVPDPVEWMASNGREDWDKYATVFGLPAPLIEAAKKMI